MKFYSRGKRHFRYKKGDVIIKISGKKKKINHPKLIVGEDGFEFLYYGVTSERKKGKSHNNYKFKVNPYNTYNGDSYLRKQIEHSPKKYFGRKLTNYSLSKVDNAYIDSLISKKK